MARLPKTDGDVYLYLFFRIAEKKKINNDSCTNTAALSNDKRQK